MTEARSALVFTPLDFLQKNVLFLTTATAAEMSKTWRLRTDLKVAEQITSTQTPPSSSTIYLSKSPLSDLSWAPVNWISFRSCSLPDIGRSWWQIGYLTHRYVSSMWFQRLSWQFIEKLNTDKRPELSLPYKWKLLAREGRWGWEESMHSCQVPFWRNTWSWYYSPFYGCI